LVSTSERTESGELLSWSDDAESAAGVQTILGRAGTDDAEGDSII